MQPPRITICGPTWRIGIELVYLPQATLEFWQKLLKVTEDAFDRQDWLKMFLTYIQTPEAEENYRKTIPPNEYERDLYRKVHGERCTVPSMGQLNLFHERLPTVVQLLKTEIEKYERRN